jgi:hypothetical protein
MPYCLSTMRHTRHTQTFMECLHRFCKDCIETCFRQGYKGKKECPICQVKVSTRRALRADPAFDKKIQMFSPDIDANEEKEEEFISQVSAGSHAMTAALHEGLCRQLEEMSPQLLVSEALGY